MRRDFNAETNKSLATA